MKTLLRFSLATLLASLLSLSASAQGRFATLDLQKVIQGYWKSKQVEATINERQADMVKESKSMQADWSKAKEEYQKLLTAASDSAVSPEEKEKRKKSAEGKLKDLRDLEETIGQFDRQARTTLQEQLLRMRNNLVGEIRAVVGAKAKAAGYTLVLDTSAEGLERTPVVLYSGNDNDLTESVLRELNANAPTDAARPAEKPVEKKQ